jgi:surface protein
MYTHISAMFSVSTSFKVFISALFLFCVSAQLAAAQTPDSFSTTWQTDNPGTSSSTAITIPTTGGGYNYTVYWEEVGNVVNNGTSTGLTGDATIDLPSAGTYRVDITGTFPRIYFNGVGDREKILTIEQWGNNPWTSFANAFASASNLTYNAVDAPDLSSVTNLSGMFGGATNFNGDLSNWDVSNVTNMVSMFQSAINFNGALNGWGTTTANVSNMAGMFNSATAFNQPLDQWDVSSVTSMSGMFSSATNFNGALNGWGTTTANVQVMRSMFSFAINFNQPIDQWDVSSVTDMGFMFDRAAGFNGTLNSWGTSTANVQDMSNMFTGATTFNQPLDQWDVTSVTTVTNMFQNATDFNSALNGWGTTTANIQNARRMFSGATAFNQPLDQWDVSGVTDMSVMFQSATNFNSALNGWGTTTANIQDASSMFNNATAFNQPLDQWDVSSLTDTESMFASASNFNQPLNAWGTTTANFQILVGMFVSASNFNQPLDQWDMGSATDISFMFSEAPNFNQSLNQWDVSSVTTMQGMFRKTTNFNQPLDQWDISSVTTGFNLAFDDISWSRDNYSATLIGWDGLVGVPSNRTLSTTAQYTKAAEAARTSLINVHGWTITDGGTPRSSNSSGTRIGDREERLADDELLRAALLAQIAELQELVRTLQAPLGTSDASTMCVFVEDLTLGSRSESVTCLQNYLITTGDFTYEGGATGYFGPVTQAAVAAWQNANEIEPAQGYWGPVSRGVYNGS